MTTARDLLTPEFLARLRLGDGDAFERLFRAWYAPLADYAARLVASADAAEDVVQDVFVAIWERRAELPDAGKLAAYLYRSVRNRGLNVIRGQATASRAVAQMDADPAVQPVVHERFEQEEVAAAVAAALESLAPRTREVFLLSRNQGLTYAQIAETLGISVKTVETLMGRGLRELRRQLLRG